MFYMDNCFHRYVPLIALIAGLVILPSVQGENLSDQGLEKHVFEITSTGPRLAGTSSENIAAGYIENELESYGLLVRVDRFEIENSFVVNDAGLRVLSPFRENIDFSLLMRSPSTDGPIVENLIHLENIPDNLDFLRGEIVLTEMNNLEEVMESSPGAIIAYRENTSAWSNVWPSGSLSVPVFTVSYETALDLAELEEESQVTMRASLDSKVEDRTSSNVIGTLLGKKEETIIVAAHHDSVFTDGAVDSASGVSAMLSVARELSDENLERTVKFISFGSEEYNLAGSRNYVSNSNISDVEAVLDIGSICPGPGGGLEVGLEGGSGKDSTPWVGEYVRRIADDMGLDPEKGELEEVETCGDYLSFVKKEVPGTWIYWTSGRGERSLWPAHTLSDNLDAVDYHRIENTSDLISSSVRELSSEDLEDWTWEYEFPERFSIFTVLSSVVFVLTMAVTGYLRYVRGKKDRRTLLTAGFADLVAVSIFYLVLISGAVQVF